MRQQAWHGLATTLRLDTVNHAFSRGAFRALGLASAGCLLLGLLGAGVSAPVARAATELTITVNTVADSTPTPGACATQPEGACGLRSAIALADSEPSGTDVTIALGSGSPTYALAQSLGPLQVVAPSGVSLTIAAPAGSAPTISGQGNTQVFKVFGPGAVAIDGVTVTGGAGVVQGAGLSVQSGAVLTLSGVTVSGNTATGPAGQAAQGGGIYLAPNATLTMVGSTVTGNSATGGNANSSGSPGEDGDGGGMYDAGILTMTNSAVTDNQATGGSGLSGTNSNGGAANGGGLDVDPNAAPPVLTALTFSGNIATGGNGGPDSFLPGTGGAATGGGIDLTSPSASLTLTNLTLSGNVARGGIGGANLSPTGIGGIGGDAIGGNLATSGTTTLVNLTIASGGAIGGSSGGIGGGASGASEGGGIGVTGGTTNVENSIVAGNLDNNCVAIAQGKVTSLGHNIEDGTSCPFSQPSDQENVSVSSLGSGKLANNGGPTQTLSLTQTSPTPNPAIDQGGSAANGCPATDQRGVFRPQGQACDVGAYEYVDAPTIGAVSPSQGALAGGFSVTITGANFVPGSTVTFGGNPATSVVVVNATTLTAQVPAATSAGAVDVTVSDPTGSNGFGDSSGQPGTLTKGFTYLAPTPTPTATPSSERLYLPFVANGASSGGP